VPARAAAAALLLGMAAYIVVPLVWLLFAATKSTQTLFSSTGFWFASSNQLGYNLRWLFEYQDHVFVRWIVNSLVYASFVALLSTVVSSMAGFAFAKYSFTGKRALFYVILGALMVPQAALVIPIFLFLKNLNLIDTYAGVIIPLVANPFGVYFMRTSIAISVPEELLDSARVDGASELRIFASIVLRIVIPALITLFLIIFVGVWNNFFLPLVVLSDQNLFPVTLGLAVWQSTVNSPGSGEPLYPLVLAGSLVSIVPLIVFFLYLRRYIVSGLTLGSLK
jgi:multiple sugar transport system permease protein